MHNQSHTSTHTHTRAHRTHTIFSSALFFFSSFSLGVKSMHSNDTAQKINRAPGSTNLSACHVLCDCRLSLINGRKHRNSHPFTKPHKSKMSEWVCVCVCVRYQDLSVTSKAVSQHLYSRFVLFNSNVVVVGRARLGRLFGRMALLLFHLLRLCSMAACCFFSFFSDSILFDVNVVVLGCASLDMHNTHTHSHTRTQRTSYMIWLRMRTRTKNCFSI